MKDLEFKIIRKGFDWYENKPFEIAFAYPSQHFQDSEFDRFEVVNYGEYKTVFNGRAYWALMGDFEDGVLFNASGEKLTYEQMVNQLKSYHDGFLFGIKELEDELVQANAISDKTNVKKRIFDIVKFNLYKSEGIPRHSGKTKKLFLMENSLYESGVKVGRNYKAWGLIVENGEWFLDLFHSDPDVLMYYENALDYWKKQGASGRVTADHLEVLVSKLIKMQSPSREYSGEIDFIISERAISKSYESFNGILFEEMSLIHYKQCFNILFPTPVHPKFIHGKMTDFAYFLSQIDRVNNQIVYSRFGVSGFDTLKSRIKKYHPRSPDIIKQVQGILKL